MPRWFRADVASHAPPLSPMIVLAAVLTNAATSVIFHGGASEALHGLEAHSGGWLRSSLVFGIASAALVIGVLLMGAGGLRPRQLGLDARELQRWIATLVVGWCSLQLAVVIIAWATPSNLVLVAPTTKALAGLVAQVFMTGVVEEVLFRGVVLTQLIRWFRVIASEPAALAIGIVCHAAVFAATHIPGLAKDGIGPCELATALALLFGIAVVYALLYLRSGSLLTLAALHALFNSPTPFAELTDDAHTQLQLALGAASVLYIALRSWPDAHSRGES